MLKKIISTILIVLFVSLVLFASLRGLPGNPDSFQVNTDEWKDDGPLELSPDRGRYALLMSVVEDKSFHFSVPLARFATPDLGYKDGNYVSLFAPAVSFLVAPGYIVGKLFGLAQVGTFAIISLFALFNVLLIRSIATKLGAGTLASSIAALVFLFATPAFAYSVTLYQHHITTLLILLSVWLLLRKKVGFWSLAIIWFLCATSIPVDYPNLFFMLPIGVYSLTKLFDYKKLTSGIRVKFNVLRIFSILAVVIPLYFFLWFNSVSYGNPLQFSGTVASVKAVDEDGNPAAPASAGSDDIERFLNPDLQGKSSVSFFSTRELPSLLYSHLLSPDRGLLYFAPIMLLGVLGVFSLYKSQPRMTALLTAVFGFNLFLYAMFGLGGWAFGSRYLIPGYSILAIFLAIALTKYGKKVSFLLLFLLLSYFSISVNTLGAITTNRNPPKVEAVALEKISGRKEHYTALRNWEFLMANKSKSFVWQTYVKDYLTAPEYFYLITGSIVVVITGQTLYLYISERRKR